MSIADRVREGTEALPAEKQAEVLDFVEFLRSRATKVVQEEADRKARLRSDDSSTFPRFSVACAHSRFNRDTVHSGLAQVSSLV